jgi:hypothetical protein
MNPVDLIKSDLGEEGWRIARRSWAETSILVLDEELSVFSTYKIFRVHGITGQFDFPILPHCSYGYYAANGKEAVRLTRANKEIQRILASDFPSFAKANPVRLASLILCFYDGGIQASHSVLADADDLRAMCRPPRHFHLDERAFATALPNLGITSCSVEGELIVLRAITLLGWMHDKRNLGIEVLLIAEDGAVALRPRLVLAKRVFDKVPGIRY